MDIQQLASQFMQSAAASPDLLKAFGADPAAAIEEATGIALNGEELDDITGIIESLVEKGEVNFEKVAELAEDLLKDGDILGKLTGLFGGK